MGDRWERVAARDEKDGTPTLQIRQLCFPSLGSRRHGEQAPAAELCTRGQLPLFHITPL
ncbi:MAG TPA: hypothetical protein VES20_19205 [Bryobacteraceae bacterium]|nr:hypothetical protein [Bryobacteraceae bacterium]